MRVGESGTFHRSRAREIQRSRLRSRGRAASRASVRHVQLPPQPVPGCDAATGAIPPLVVVVVGRTIEGVVPRVVEVVVGGVDDASFDGVIETS